MRLSLKPQEDVFYKYFNDAAVNIAAGIGVLAELTVPHADVEAVAKKLVDYEHKGDTITHDLIRTLNSTFVTPFDREDIYRLASALDDIIDHAEAAVTFAHLSQAPELPHEIHELISVLSACAQATADAMPRLKPRKDLEKYWIEINKLENDGDRAHRAALVTLFSGQYDALSVLKLSHIANELEAAIDAFEHVANSVETVMVKES